MPQRRFWSTVAVLAIISIPFQVTGVEPGKSVLNGDIEELFGASGTDAFCQPAAPAESLQPANVMELDLSFPRPIRGFCYSDCSPCETAANCPLGEVCTTIPLC